MRALLSSYQRARCPELVPSKPCDGNFATFLARAGITLGLIRGSLLVAVVIGVVGCGVGGVVLGATMTSIGIGAACLGVWLRARRNRRAVDRDLPALLTSVASSVRAGIDPVTALITAREYVQKNSPVARELEQVRDRLVNGEDEETVIEGFLSIYASQEGELFKRCLILSRRHGSSLADPLHRITKVVRQRQSFRRKVTAALAMHRMSAVGITLCAVAMGALQFGMNPRAIDIALNHPVGGLLLIVGASLIAIGVVWMMVIGRETAAR
ncbi:MAG: hypothetical protein RIS36_2192 [Pseudomonadota bacterium]